MFVFHFSAIKGISRSKLSSIARECTAMGMPVIILVVCYSFTVSAFDQSWLDSVVDSNCSSFLHISLSSEQTSQSSPTQENESNSSHQFPHGCPPWFYKSGDDQCVAGNYLSGRIHWNKHTMQTSVQHLYCMTTTPSTNKTIVGGCLFSAMYLSHSYVPLPCNASELNDYTCAGLNREGQLCGKCKEGYAPPVYSYSMKCVRCVDYQLNWAKYLVVGFVPLTAFFIFVSTCHISPTSPYLHGLVYFSHILCLPFISRLFVLLEEFYTVSDLQVRIGDIYFSLFGVWNLDFFRYLYEPFCIHPHMTTVQALALDYLIASYPLFLLLLTYILVQLDKRTCRPLDMVCKPLNHIWRSIKCKINNNSLVDSFATIMLLSTMKFQSTTFDLLMPIRIYNMNGSSDSRLYLFMAGNVEYFGPEHLPYAITALVVLICLIIIPTLLLFLYPCHCCQMLLNKFHCNSQVLRTFMDVFQGNYNDKTSNTRDCRYFAGIFFVSRTLIVLAIACLNSLYIETIFGFIFLLLGLSMALMRPQKSNVHYTIDMLYISILSALFFTANAKNVHYSDQSLNGFIFRALALIILALPLLYMIGLSIIWLWHLIRNLLPQRSPRKCLALCALRLMKCIQNAGQPQSEEQRHLIAIS